MTQKEQVIEAMRKNGGYATFNQLYNLIDMSSWKTKTPQASVREIVQRKGGFFKIRPGLWGLSNMKEEVLKRLKIEESNSQSQDLFTHSYFQGMIVEIGNMINVHERDLVTTYIPNQDRNRLFLEKKLSDIAMVKEIPQFTGYKNILDRARTIDVIWFNERNMPFRFYEVEHSTNITNSLDKFYELQDFRADYYIVADKSRKKQFDDCIERSIYRKIKDYVKFKSYEDLVSQYKTDREVSEMADRL